MVQSKTSLYPFNSLFILLFFNTHISLVHQWCCRILLVGIVLGVCLRGEQNRFWYRSRSPIDHLHHPSKYSVLLNCAFHFMILTMIVL